MSKETYTKRIKSLKEKLNQQALSAMIGAGFSKNFDFRFPSWKELLMDASKEMFEGKIKADYELLKATSKRTRISSFKKFLEQRLDLYIKDIGYLGLVSAYLQQKGFSEAIATYIEDRVPYLDYIDGKDYLIVNQQKTSTKIEVDKTQLELHKKLIRLPWNNIYTTNYDNLIEYCIDSNIKKDLIERIEKIKDEIRSNETKLLELVKKLAETKSKIAKYAESDGEIPDAKDKIIEPIIARGDKELRYKLKNNESQLQGEIDHLNRVNRERTRKITKLESLKEETYSVLTHSSELALKRHRNIIKLHGTLRKPGEPYGFDNDTQNHYIISKEDFENYPLRHEAFTQLMRISLLKESFCLIGFSGEDPNFMAWIGWVRDIIEKRDDKKSANDDKIYLIEASAHEASVEKSLFYSNHRIAHIPILNEECITFLETQTGKKLKDRTSRKEALQILLEYLDIQEPNKAGIALETFNQEDYKDYWSRFPHYSFYNVDFNADVFYGGVGKVPSSLKASNRIPSIQFCFGLRKNELLFFADKHVSLIKDPTIRENFLQLVATALDDTFVPHSCTLDSLKDLTNVSKSFPKIHERYKLLDAKCKVWENPFTPLNVQKFSDRELNQELLYYRILRRAFTLNFELLKKEINQWKASGHWAMKKAGLLALIDLEGAIKLLRNHSQVLYQEELFHHRILNYFSLAKNLTFDRKESNEYIRKLEAEGLTKLDENTDYIIEKFSGPTHKHAPYGDGKFSISNTSKSTNVKPDLAGFQFFGLLIELGLPLSLPRVNFSQPDKVYPIINNSFEGYPFPVLFYSLQFSDDKILKRIGQDYAYSTSLAPQLERISRSMLQAYFNQATPNQYKKSILTLHSELLVAIDPHLWETDFRRLWDERLKKKVLFQNDRFNQDPFIEKSLRFIKSPAIIEKVVRDCLSHVKKENIGSITQYLFTLANNKHLKRGANKILTTKLKRTIQNSIKDLCKQDPSVIFIFGNINELLSKNDRSNILKSIHKVDFKKVENERTWYILIFFSNGDTTLDDKMKPFLLESLSLWYTGISEDEKSLSSNTYSFLSLSRLTKSKESIQGIVWTKDELNIIYNKLVKEILRIEKVSLKENDFVRYDSILEEMLAFLERHFDELSKISSYPNIISLCKKLYIHERGYSTIKEGLISGNQTQVVLAISELAKELYRDKTITENSEMIQLLLYKLIMKVDSGLGATLHYIPSWFYYFKKEPVLKQFKDALVSILKLYHEEPPTNLDYPFIEEKLTTLAVVLDFWGVNDQIVKDYSAKIKTSRFNNVKEIEID